MKRYNVLVFPNQNKVYFKHLTEAVKFLKENPHGNDIEDTFTTGLVGAINKNGKIKFKFYQHYITDLDKDLLKRAKRALRSIK